MIEYKSTSSSKEIEEIILLQRENLFENVSEQERVSQGFVTVKHTFDQLLDWHQNKPHTIAVLEGHVVGYSISMLRKYRTEVPVLVPLFDTIDQNIKPNLNYMVMGQICIHKDYRGKGVFRGLYEKMQASCRDYDWIVTEVDTSNLRSIHAHRAIGFRELISYKSDGQTWSLIYLD
jgi:ribosomal protein S18 acetylase RimI-like enzyme